MGKITLIPCDWRRWGQRQAELRDEDKVSGGAARAIWAQWPAARATGQWSGEMVGDGDTDERSDNV